MTAATRRCGCRPHSTPQEEIVVYLRTHLRLSLDDLLAVVREFIEPTMSRSGLDRLLRRRGVNRLPEPEVAPTQSSRSRPTSRATFTWT
jgi:hypothetical protein